MSETWKNDLKPIGTNWKKEHITEAPYLISKENKKQKKF